jgi:dienelactone hydrolase
LSEVVLFHHAQGLTEGVRAFADELCAAGHSVHTPDLFDGRTFPSLEAGMAFAEELGFGSLIERGTQVAGALPAELVYAGFSLGVLPAQKLAQTRAGARGALLMQAAIPSEDFGGAWPEGVPLQLHVMENDALGDVEIARVLAETIPEAELFLYPGDRHLFADRGLPDYDADAAALLMERALTFLG